MKSEKHLIIDIMAVLIMLIGIIISLLMGQLWSGGIGVACGVIIMVLNEKLNPFE